MDDTSAPLTDRGHSRLIAIGRVRKPFGLKGLFYADAFGRALGMLSLPARVFCGKDEGGATAVTVSEMRETPRGFIGKFAGIDSIESAQVFRETYLFLEKNDLPDLGEREYYHFELEGLSVVALPENKAVGTVVDLESFPTTDALVVRKDDGSTFLIAMKSGMIRKIDRANGYIFVDGAALEEIV
jgi:16S rRNA processing protein RimM